MQGRIQIRTFSTRSRSCHGYGLGIFPRSGFFRIRFFFSGIGPVLFLPNPDRFFFYRIWIQIESSGSERYLELHGLCPVVRGSVEYEAQGPQVTCTQASPSASFIFSILYRYSKNFAIKTSPGHFACQNQNVRACQN